MTQERLYRYLRGESTAAERQQILQWINASSENMHMYRTMRSVYDTMLCGEADLHLRKLSTRKHHHKLARYTVTSVLGAGLCAAMFLFGINFVWQPDPVIITANQIDCIVSPIGQRTELTLADGTHVWLSSNSRLQLPSDGSSRRVALTGEAFFDVVKDATTPFVVSTSGRNITVYGTKFNVNAYSGEEAMDVQLYEGSVSVTDSASTRTVTLAPGQQLRAETGGLTVTEFEQYGSGPLWIQGIHSFQNCTFAEILTRMSHVYDIRLSMETSWTETQRCTCKFHEADGLENMLKSLDDIRPFSYQWDPDSRLLRIK